MPQPIKTPSKHPILEPQDLLRAEGLQQWFVENLKTVVAVVGVLVLAGSAWGIVQFLQHRSEEQAAGLYAEAMNTYQATQAPDRQLRVLSPETIAALEQAISEFQAVRDAHPQTRHAALALFHQANAYAALGRFDEAVARYNTWLADYPKNPLAPLVVQRFGYALWVQGKPEEALARFNQVIAIPDAPNRDLSYFEKGRVLEQMGQNAQALEAYTALAKEYMSSPWTSEGNARIIALGGTPPGQEPDAGAAPTTPPAAAQGENQPPPPTPPSAP